MTLLILTVLNLLASRHSAIVLTISYICINDVENSHYDFCVREMCLILSDMFIGANHHTKKENNGLTCSHNICDTYGVRVGGFTGVFVWGWIKL